MMIAILFVIGCAIVALCTVAVYSWRRLDRLRQQTETIESRLDTLARDFARLCQARVNQDERICEQDKQLQLLTERIEDIRGQDQFGQSFHAAISDARKGVSVQALIAQHGLIQDEAELLVRLHGNLARAE